MQNESHALREIWPSRRSGAQRGCGSYPLAGQVRIATEACGVNFPDTLIIENKYQFKPDLPFAPGGEVTGIVDAVGDGVSQDLLGQPVMCMTLSGGFAEQTLCKAEDLIARPSFMPAPSQPGLP